MTEFRSSGKPIVAFLESAGLAEYYLASAADEIVLAPTGDLSVAGISIETGFMRGVLDNVGVTPDFFHAGKYKSYSEQFTETEMSEPHREATNDLLDDLYGQFVTDIAHSRGLEPSELESIIDRGPFTGQEALDYGLIDRLGYYDEIRADAGNGPPELVSLRNVNAPAGFSLSTPPIALVYAVGQIVSGPSVEDVFGGRALGSDTMAEVLRELRGKEGIKAVVIRVDSPGGSGLASDIIWREIELLKDAGKTVVVSMGDLAASGGYYISAGADVIVAEPGTLTGSIGVVTGKFALDGLYDKIGYHSELTARGRNAGLYSSSRPFTESQREVIVRQMNAFYSEFVDRVSQGRDMTWDEVDAIAQGRVWTGRPGGGDRTGRRVGRASSSPGHRQGAGRNTGGQEGPGGRLPALQDVRGSSAGRRS